MAIAYLFRHRPGWRPDAAVGKTLVSSSMIDRVASDLGRRLAEVPVGFKWFVDGLVDGSFGFGGEESAGASFLRKDGTVWTTDKDGILLDLLACEIRAVTGRDPGELYRDLEGRFGSPVYERIDAPASREQKAALGRLSPEAVKADTLAGEPILARLTKAPANDAPIGGLKVVTENGWFAARPSGTEDVYKLYAESFKGRDHLVRIQDEARAIVAAALPAEARCGPWLADGVQGCTAAGSDRSRRIRMAPRRTRPAIAAPMTRSGTREPVQRPTSAPAAITPRLASTSLAEKM